MGNFKFIPHTADIAVQITAKTMEDLFSMAASALKSAVVEDFKSKNNISYKLNCSAQILEELLVIFLNEINYLYFSKKFIFCQVAELSIKKPADQYMAEAVLMGENFSLKHHIFKEEIKAVTYHNLEIKNTDEGFSVTIVFDI
jgi:SHS2 domain-containing protein